MEQLAKAHARVVNIRANTIHQATSLLAKTKSAIVVEDLAVANLIQNPKLSRCIADVGWGAFLMLLTYKCQW